jgi:hypothetical protein
MIIGRSNGHAFCLKQVLNFRIWSLTPRLRGRHGLCGDLGKPFAFCLNKENARREVLNSSAEAHVRKLGVILSEHVLDRAVYVSALNKGKTGPEHPDAKQAKEARAEIEALWQAVKSLTEKARAAR